jgi:hypothetical protein
VEISGVKVGKYQNTKISKNCSGILSAFRYLGTTVKNYN